MGLGMEFGEIPCIVSFMFESSDRCHGTGSSVALTNANDAFALKFDSLMAAVGSLSNAMDTKFDSIQKNMDSMAKNMLSMEKNIDAKMLSMEKNIDAKMLSMEKNMDAKMLSMEKNMDAKMLSMEKNIDSIKKISKDNTKKLEAMDTKIEVLGSEVAVVAAHSQNVRIRAKNARAFMDSKSPSFDRLYKEKADHNLNASRVGALPPLAIFPKNREILVNMKKADILRLSAWYNDSFDIEEGFDDSACVLKFIDWLQGN
jgi:hypothetical protein